jgi:hypothetical protein
MRSRTVVVQYLRMNERTTNGTLLAARRGRAGRSQNSSLTFFHTVHLPYLSTLSDFSVPAPLSYLMYTPCVGRFGHHNTRVLLFFGDIIVRFIFLIPTLLILLSSRNTTESPSSKHGHGQPLIKRRDYIPIS